MNKKGLFISFEGIEGVGKSTAIKYISNELKSKQIDFVLNREPGGTEISEAIRQVLLSHHQETMCEDTELLLMFACRAQNLAKIIKPALQKGIWVLSDRFTDATFAYQGYGRGIPAEKIATLARLVHNELKPDIIFLLDAPVELSFERLKRRHGKDRIESEDLDFFERVRQGYLELAKQYPQHYKIIQADHPLLKVQYQLSFALNQIIKQSEPNSGLSSIY